MQLTDEQLNELTKSIKIVHFIACSLCKEEIEIPQEEDWKDWAKLRLEDHISYSCNVARALRAMQKDGITFDDLKKIKRALDEQRRRTMENDTRE